MTRNRALDAEELAQRSFRQIGQLALLVNSAQLQGPTYALRQVEVASFAKTSPRLGCQAESNNFAR